MSKVLVLALAVFALSSCAEAERCCEVMFPNRPSAAAILDGYAAKRVYSQNDLILSIQDTSIRKIVIAESFSLTQAITLPASRAGLEIEGVHGARLLLAEQASAVFVLEGERQTVRGVFAAASNQDTGSGATFAVIRAADVTVERCVIENLLKLSVVENGPHDRVRVLYNRVTPLGSGTTQVYVEGEDSVVQGNSFYEASAIEVGDNSSFTLVSGNSLRRGTSDAVFVHGASTLNVSIVGNACNGGNIETSTSGGGNAIVGNTGAFLNSHPDDVAAGNT